MTATIPSVSRHDILEARLAALRSQRSQALAEIIPSGDGDMADRATNVDGHVRLAMIEERIANVESKLDPTRGRGARSPHDTVAVGDIVTVDFGDGPESFLLGSVEEATDALDVITPDSPLGQALQRAHVGSKVSYTTGPRRTFSATIIAVN